MGSPGGSDGKNLPAGLGRSPGVGHSDPLQYFCLENPQGQRCLVGYSPWGHKASDTAEQLNIAQCKYILNVAWDIFTLKNYSLFI